MKVRVIWDSEVTQTIKLTTWRYQKFKSLGGKQQFLDPKY